MFLFWRTCYIFIEKLVIFLFQDPYHNTYFEKLCRHWLFHAIAHKNAENFWKNKISDTEIPSQIGDFQIANFCLFSARAVTILCGISLIS